MKYSSLLLKLSGESLGGVNGQSPNPLMLQRYAREIKPLAEAGIRIAIVTGKGVDRVHGDLMGMLATTINSIALADALEDEGMKALVYTATPMEAVARYYNRDHALAEMNAGTIVLLSGGTGNPFFTTDSAAALRAVELGVDVLLKGTRVDGVYTADPEKDPGAEKFEALTFDRVLEKNLKIMDTTAFTLCRENKMPVIVFNMNVQGNLQKLVNGEAIGTIIK